MGWEAGFWAAVGVASPWLVEWYRVEARVDPNGRLAFLPALAPWIYGLGPPYLALLTGAITARQTGVYGSGGVPGWLGGMLVCGLVFVGALAVRQFWNQEWPAPGAMAGALDEPRWAMYRSIGWLWSGGYAWGLLIGLGLALFEWASRSQPWRPAALERPAAGVLLGRIALSSVLFSLTGNLWLTLVTQAAVLAAVGHQVPNS